MDNEDKQTVACAKLETGTSNEDIAPDLGLSIKQVSFFVSQCTLASVIYIIESSLCNDKKVWETVDSVTSRYSLYIQSKVREAQWNLYFTGWVKGMDMYTTCTGSVFEHSSKLS